MVMVIVDTTGSTAVIAIVVGTIAIAIIIIITSFDTGY